MVEPVPVLGQLTASSIRAIRGLTSRAASAAVEIARDLGLAGLALPLAPSIASGTPASDLRPRTYLSAPAEPGQAVWLTRLFTKLDYLAGDPTSQQFVRELVVCANQVWQADSFSFGWIVAGPAKADDIEEFDIARREAVAFAQQLSSREVAMASPELLALARQAAQRLQARQAEDVQTWADRLARDVGDAVD